MVVVSVFLDYVNVMFKAIIWGIVSLSDKSASDRLSSYKAKCYCSSEA